MEVSLDAGEVKVEGSDIVALYYPPCCAKPPRLFFERPKYAYPDAAPPQVNLRAITYARLLLTPDECLYDRVEDVTYSTH